MTDHHLFIDYDPIFRMMDGYNMVFVGDSLVHNQFLPLACQLYQLDENCQEVARGRKDRSVYSAKYNLQLSYFVTETMVNHSNFTKLYHAAHEHPTSSPHDSSNNNDSSKKAQASSAWGMSITVNFGYMKYLQSSNTSNLNPIIKIANPVKQIVLLSTGNHLLHSVHGTYQYSFIKTLLEFVCKEMYNHFQRSGINPTIIWRSNAPRQYQMGDWDRRGVCSSDKYCHVRHDYVPHPKISPVNGSMYIAPADMYDYLAENIYNGRFISEALAELSRKYRFKFLNTTAVTDHRCDAVSGRSVYGHVFDCSHYCMPGVPDAWNALLFKHLFHSTKTKPS